MRRRGKKEDERMRSCVVGNGIKGYEVEKLGSWEVEKEGKKRR